MKRFTLLAASLAIPAVIASAQTPSTPSTTTTSGIPFIPLISNGGGTSLTGTTNPSTAWFIDTARSLVVFCSQNTTASSGGAQTPSFACTAQPVPTSASGGTSGGATPGAGTSGSGTPESDSGATGGAGSNPMGG